jgi:NADH-quinone oxidoreductase subunit J
VDATALFYVVAGIAVAAALGAVLNTRDTVASSLSLVVTMVSLAAVYLLLDAYLLAVLQIIVYSGSIAVVFLFAVMFTGLRAAPFDPPRTRWLAWAGVVLAGLLVAQLTGIASVAAAAGPPPAPEGYGGYRAIGLALYTDYVLLVESVGLLLLAAIVGAVILAKRDID